MTLKTNVEEVERWTIKNTLTGEIKNAVTLTEDHVLVNKKSAKAYKEKLEKEKYVDNYRGKNFVACYHDTIKETSKEMTLFECGAVLKLLLFINFKDKGLLVKEGKPMNLKEIQKTIKKGETQTRAIINRLEELHILKKEKVGRSNFYKVNSRFHTMGEILENSHFTKLYQVKTKELLDKVNLNQAGILYKILPYFHFYNCYLCLDPNEQDDTKIHFLSQEELSELINVDSDTISKHIKALKDKAVILEAQTGKAVNYYVHPDLMFRMQSDNDKTIAVRKIFYDLEMNIKNKENKMNDTNE